MRSGMGIFAGPNDEALVAAIRSWNSNVVRIPLNEQCWLGINGLDPQYSGAPYREAIRDFVDLVHKHGMCAELSLMWAAPGTEQAAYQPEAPNADHSPAFWQSLATAYKDVPNVLLAPWGEPTVNFDCWLNGGCTATFKEGTFTTAGSQQAVNVMRAAGYKGPIVIPGVRFANDLSQWLAYRPVDPLDQIVAEAHVYGGNQCMTVECFDSEYAPVAAEVPLFFGETGETYDASSCGSTNIEQFMDWVDAHGVGYAAWQWNPWQTCLDLTTDYYGMVADSDYARAVHAHYATLD
jgi:endoglucanase